MELDDQVVWITTRRIKEGAYEDFRRAWRPREFPDGMLRAYECFAGEKNEVVGISTWESLEARETYRLSDVEAERRKAMAPFVESESSGLYAGRDMRTAHAGLNVTHDAFDRVVAHLVDTLASLDVPLEIIEAIGAKLAPLRVQIVTAEEEQDSPPHVCSPFPGN